MHSRFLNLVLKKPKEEMWVGPSHILEQVVVCEKFEFCMPQKGLHLRCPLKRGTCPFKRGYSYYSILLNKCMVGTSDR